MRAVQVFLTSGSHFLSNAEWGCLDGEHKAWLLVETENRKEAMRILPSYLQQNARIIQLNKFSRKDMDEAVLEGIMSTLCLFKKL